MTTPTDFEIWFEDLRSLALRDDNGWAISPDPEDHRDGWIAGYTPEEEYHEQLSACVDTEDNERT